MKKQIIELKCKCGKMRRKPISQPQEFTCAECSLKKLSSIKYGDLQIEEKIMADVDDKIGGLVDSLAKKHKISWNKSRDFVNYALRILMLSYPEEWIKIKRGQNKK